jgi:hypothetical protein
MRYAAGNPDFGGIEKNIGNVQKVRHFNKPLKATPIPNKFPSPLETVS